MSLIQRWEIRSLGKSKLIFVVLIIFNFIKLI